MWPPSLSTGITSPSDVAVRMTAASSGSWTTPARRARRRRPARARAETSEADGRDPQQSAAELVEVDLETGEEQQEGEPDDARIRTGSSTVAQPSTWGPTMMPATISSTTAGTRSAGCEPERERDHERDPHDHRQAVERDTRA